MKRLSILAALFLIAGCSGSPGEGDWYRLHATGDTVRVLGLGKIGEMRVHFAGEFRAESLCVETGRKIASIDSQRAALGPRYQAVKDSLVALQVNYRAEGAVYDQTISEYTDCCAFRQYGHFIIIPLSDFEHDYEKISR